MRPAPLRPHSHKTPTGFRGLCLQRELQAEYLAEQERVAQEAGKVLTEQRVGAVADEAPDQRWDVFQAAVATWVQDLPEGLVRVAWREGEPVEFCLGSDSVAERLLAALHRDGAVTIAIKV